MIKLEMRAKLSSVELISNAFGLKVEGEVTRALRLEKPGVSIRVLLKYSDQLAEEFQKAFSVFVVRSRHMPQLVECAAAAAEGENYKHLKPLGPLVSFPASDATAEGGI